MYVLEGEFLIYHHLILTKVYSVINVNVKGELILY